MPTPENLATNKNAELPSIGGLTVEYLHELPIPERLLRTVKITDGSLRRLMYHPGYRPDYHEIDPEWGIKDPETGMINRKYGEDSGDGFIIPVIRHCFPIRDPNQWKGSEVTHYWHPSSHRVWIYEQRYGKKAWYGHTWNTVRGGNWQLWRSDFVSMGYTNEEWKEILSIVLGTN